MIFDIVGRPKEHLTQTLNKLIQELDSEKGVSVKSKDIKEPTTMKENEEFFTTFAEVEVEVDSVSSIAILLFKYMPANLEIISPEVIAMSNSGWNDVLNELARRLHGYDEIARMMQAERAFFLEKIKEKGIDIKDLIGKKKPIKKEDKKTEEKK